jgi:hypothetical protein
LDHADFDGDGVDDLLIASVTGSDRHEPALGGSVHVVLGGARHTGFLELADVSAHEFYGATESSALGGSGGVDAMDGGDLNGDGLTDLVFGAANTEDRQGRGHVFLGPLPEGATVVSDADWTITGAALDGTAETVQIAHDLDADGYGDLLVSESDAGRVLVFRGSASWSGDVEPDARDFSLYSSLYPYSPGRHISTGDLNGDGQEDVVLGDEYYADYRGGVWMVYGPVTANVDLDAQVAASTIGVLVGDEGTRIGRQAVTGGDVNGDGLDDILLGSEYYSHSAYLIYSEGL